MSRTSIPNDECAVDDIRSGIIANIEASKQPRLPRQEVIRYLDLAISWANAIDDYIVAHSDEDIPPRS